MPAISIVVPIYNMEKYVARCLESLLLQTFADLEIVAVNDGSRDSSLAILRRYAEADSRIVVIDRENGGVSSARNEGIRAARGDYIGFADPDDWADPDMYGALYEAAAEEDADIVMCGYTREFGDRSAEKTFHMPSRLVSRGAAVQRFWTRRLIGPLREELAHPDYLDAWGTVWSKLYRASLIKSGRLAFVDLGEIGSCEDSLFNIQAFHRAGSFVFLNRPYYHYWRANESSVTTRHKPDLAARFEALYKRMEAFVDGCGPQNAARLAAGSGGSSPAGGGRSPADFFGRSPADVSSTRRSRSGSERSGGGSASGKRKRVPVPGNGDGGPEADSAFSREEYRLALSNRVCMNVVGLGLNIVSRSNPASAWAKIRSLRALVRGERVGLALARMEFGYCPPHWRLFFLCARLKQPAALYLLLLAMERLRTRGTGGAASETGANFAGSYRDEPRRTGNDADELLPSDGSRTHSI